MEHKEIIKTWPQRILQQLELTQMKFYILSAVSF